MSALSLFIPSVEHERSETNSGPVREIFDRVLDELQTAEELVFRAVENQILDEKRNSHIGVRFGRKLDALGYEDLVVTEPVRTPERDNPEHRAPTIAELEQAGPINELEKKRQAVAVALQKPDGESTAAVVPKIYQPTQVKPQQDWSKFEATHHDPYTYPKAA